MTALGWGWPDGVKCVGEGGSWSWRVLQLERGYRAEGREQAPSPLPSSCCLWDFLLAEVNREAATRALGEQFVELWTHAVA